MPPCVAYYRVSTDRQGRSGLGLDAQRQAVSLFLAEQQGALIADFTEIESGRKKDRPQLAAALALCRQRRARLVIAKLDRLARNVAFISNLMESGVEFVAVDMPQANRFMIHILAAVAEYEAGMISTRIKDALAAAKRRGTKLGNPLPGASLTRGRDTITAHLDQHRAQVSPLVSELRGAGLSLRAVAAELNRQGVPTARGKQWEAATVRGVLNTPPL